MTGKVSLHSKPGESTIIFIGAFDSISPNAAFVRLQGILASTSKHFSHLFYTQKIPSVSISVPGNTSGSSSLQQIPYTCIWRTIPSIGFLSTIARIVLAAKSAPEAKVIIVLYNFSSVISLLLYILSFLTRSKIVADLSELYNYKTMKKHWQLIYGSEFRLRFFLAANFASSCIFSSQYLRRSVLRLRLSHRLVRDCVIPTLIPPSEPKAKVRISERFSSPLKFLFPTQNFERDGLKVILKAFLDLQLQYAKEFQLLILLGSSPKDKLIQYLQEHKIHQPIMSSASFKICEKISRSQYREVLESSHYIIFFRQLNLQTLSGYPTKLSESMEYSIPFVTNHFPQYSEAGVTQEYGYYLPTEFTDFQLRELLISLFEASPEEWIKKAIKCSDNNPTSAYLFEEELLHAFS